MGEVVHAQNASPAKAANLQPPAHPGLSLQRKCACKGTGNLTGQCAECEQKKKLQRQASDAADSFSRPPIVGEVLRSPGQLLDGSTQSFMQTRFGHDFGKVRIHADRRAAEAAASVKARAFTVGRAVVFWIRTISNRTRLWVSGHWLSEGSDRLNRNVSQTV